MLSNNSPESKEPLTRNNKGMLALVIGLGVLIIVATTVLVFVIIGRIMHKKDANPQEFSQSYQIIRPVSVLQEPQGTRIVSTMRQSDQVLVLSLSGGGQADRVVIWDLQNQKKLQEIKMSLDKEPTSSN